MNTQETIAVFPGTFDPVTLGHLDLIQRAARVFNRVIVGVGHNPEKAEMFSPADRVEMIRELVEELDLDHVTVEAYDGLTMRFVRSVGGNIILRGIRDGSDLRDELQFANTNLIVGDVETVFFMTSERHALTSSTLIKQILEIGGIDTSRLANLIPSPVLRRLQARMGKDEQ